MPKIEGGLVGISAMEVWLPEAMKQQHDRNEAEYRKGMSAKMRKGMVSVPFMPPWTSVGIAPTEEQLRENNYGGSA